MSRTLRTIALSALIVLAGTAGCTSGGGSPPQRSPSSSSLATEGLIAFSADTGSGYQIYTVRPDGTGLHQITHVDGGAVRPRWSPDGTHITFSVENAANPPPYCSIKIMNADGSHIVDLTGHRNGCEGDGASFSPDGSYLVFGRYDDVTNQEAIWRMDLHGKHRRRITDVGSAAHEISPDGTKLAFVPFSEQGNSLWVADADPVGRWSRLETCQELVEELDAVGLGAFAATPFGWQGNTSAQGEGSFAADSPKPTRARPCTGAIPRKHSHFFTEYGQFGSLDWRGGQVDDAPYEVIDANMVRIGTAPIVATFHYRILHGATLFLSPVLTNAMIHDALDRAESFTAAVWAVGVAYAGHAWKRVPCQSWC